ncbi:MAG: hypothetical protein SFU56_06450 [Capsulimonadales bacterium]|nr:hypothetical protein [Capsulimonadales bacterium]
MIVRPSRALAPIVLLITAAASASAQILTPLQKYEGNVENQGTVLLDLDYGGAGTYDFLNVYIGSQDTTLTGYGGQPDPIRFDTYCIDLLTAINHDPHPVELLPTDVFPLGRPGVNHGGSIAWLYNRYAGSAVADNRQAAALQIALWEAQYDWDGSAFVGGTNGSIDLKNGYFQYGGVVGGSAVDTDLIARANTMLTDWSGRQDQATWFRDPAGSQPLIGPPVRGNNIPEPNVAVLSLLGLAGMAVFRQRFLAGR